MTSPVALRGSLAVFHLPALLQLLAVESSTGILQIKRRFSRATVVFDRGEVIRAARGGEISGTEREVDREDVFDVLVDLLRWKTGEFSFEPKHHVKPTQVRERADVLVLECLRRLDERGNEEITSAA